MTKQRDPATFEDAALTALHLLGVETCARLIDRTPGAVRKYADPESDGRPIIHHALTLDAACRARDGRTPFLAAYRAQLKLLAAADGAAPLLDPVLEALDVAQAVGNLAAEVRAARCHHSEAGTAFSPGERHDLLRLVARARQELDDLERAVRENPS